MIEILKTYLNLVDSGDNFTVRYYPVHLFRIEVRYTNGLGQAKILGLLHALPSLQVVDIGGRTVLLEKRGIRKIVLNERLLLSELFFLSKTHYRGVITAHSNCDLISTYIRFCFP